MTDTDSVVSVLLTTAKNRLEEESNGISAPSSKYAKIEAIRKAALVPPSATSSMKIGCSCTLVITDSRKKPDL